MDNNRIGKMKYTVDIVFCIDATASMRPILSLVKDNAINFYSDLTNALRRKNKEVDTVRIKLIAFRDYIADGDEAMLVTDFFNLPYDIDEFKDTVRGIEPIGGGDIPEDALEALAYAIRSDWSKAEKKRRQIIVLWSDAPPHPLGYCRSADTYPSGMVRDIRELTDWWVNEQLGYMNKRAKRLILYTPQSKDGYDEKCEYPWENIVNNWDNIVHYPSSAGTGLEEINYQQILSAIVESI